MASTYTLRNIPFFSIIPVEYNLNYLERIALEIGILALYEEGGAPYQISEQELSEMRKAVLKSSYVWSPLRIAEVPNDVENSKLFSTLDLNFKKEDKLFMVVLLPEPKDFLVSDSIARVLNTMLDSSFSEHSYGFRQNRGKSTFVQEMNNLGAVELLLHLNLTSNYLLIDRAHLLSKLYLRTGDRQLSLLVQSFLSLSILDKEEKDWSRDEGIPPVGSLLAFVLFNLYLEDLDQKLSHFQNSIWYGRFVSEAIIAFPLLFTFLG